MHQLRRRIAAICAALVAVLMVVVAVLVAIGQVSFVVTHGTSMHPVYYEGDLVVVAPSAGYEVGDIVAYREPGREGVVLHRIIGGDTNGFVFKGDSNESTDPGARPADQIVGRPILHIPEGGLWLDRLTSPVALGLIAFALLGAGAGRIHTRRRRRRPTMSRHSQWTLLPALSPRLRIAAILTAVVGALAVVLGAIAWLFPPGPSAAPQGSKKLVFSYSADVGQSAAYDSTTAESPDPVFRSLADTVDLHVAYAGAPGSIALSAELSTPGGWRSRVPLDAPASFAGDSYEETVQLDLAAIDAKAQAASSVTGLPSSPVTISITARVETAGDPVFEPTLQLVLAPLHLSLAGDAKTLTVTESAPPVASPGEIQPLRFLGLEIPVDIARITAIVALAAVLLTGAALTAIAARTRTTDEGADIRRRYGRLLIPVRKLPDPPRGRVVEVADFPTLARLAERYALLVMHWTDGKAQTFVVQDQETTYRYRIPGNEPRTVVQEPASPQPTTAMLH